jgi:hypothetical protein
VRVYAISYEFLARSREAIVVVPAEGRADGGAKGAEEEGEGEGTGDVSCAGGVEPGGIGSAGGEECLWG